MAWGAIIGSLLSAGGQVAGGLLGQGDGGQGKTARYNPAMDYALRAAQFDAMNQIGFGNIGSMPSPFQQFISQLQATPMADKNRNAVIKALSVIRNNPELLDDPSGENFSRAELRGFLENPDTMPSGRRLPNGMSGDGGSGVLGSGTVSKIMMKGDRPLPIENLPELKKALRGMGIGVQDLRGLLESESRWQEDINKLKAAGLDRIQTDTILNRAEASRSASSLLGDAGRFATGGDPSTFQTGLLDRINRGINDQEEALMLRAQYGGFNPSAGLEGIQRMRGDSEMTALQEAINAASALTASLNIGNGQVQQAAGLGSNAALSAMGLVAQQAMAANQLGQNGAINRSDSLANGVAGGASGLGQSLTLASLLGNQSNAPASQFSMYGGPGSTQNQLGTQLANYGGWNSNADW